MRFPPAPAVRQVPVMQRPPQPPKVPNPPTTQGNRVQKPVRESGWRQTGGRAPTQNNRHGAQSSSGRSQTRPAQTRGYGRQQPSAQGRGWQHQGVQEQQPRPQGGWQHSGSSHPRPQVHQQLQPTSPYGSDSTSSGNQGQDSGIDNQGYQSDGSSRPSTPEPDYDFESIDLDSMREEPTSLTPERKGVLNQFLKDKKLNVKYEGGELRESNPKNARDAEDQPPIKLKRYEKILNEALKLKLESPEKHTLYNDLMAVITQGVQEHFSTALKSAATSSDLSFIDTVKKVVKNVGSGLFHAWKGLAGRDLAIDDLFGSLNIDGNESLANGGWAKHASAVGAVLTSFFMLGPTLTKFVPEFIKAVQEQDAKGAAKAISKILPIVLMTANPVLGAAGLSRAAAAAGAAGNIAMVLGSAGLVGHFKEIFEHSSAAKDENLGSYSRYAAKSGVIDVSTHTALDLLHETIAQLVFAGLNIANAVSPGRGDIPEATWGAFTALFSPVVIESALRGKQSFEETSRDGDILEHDFASQSPTAFAAKLALQQHIEQSYNAEEYNQLLNSTLGDPGKDGLIGSQIGLRRLSDDAEKSFIQGLFETFHYKNPVDKENVREAIEAIFSYQDKDKIDKFIGENGLIQDTELRAMLMHLQEQRQADKAWGRNQRGAVAANNVFNQFIAPAIKSVSYQEIQSSKVAEPQKAGEEKQDGELQEVISQS